MAKKKKKATAKKTVTKKKAVKKAASKKSAKKAASKKTTKKTAAKKKTTKKAAIKKTAKKSTAKKAATKKKATKKSSIKKAAPKKPATKKSTVKKAGLKKTAKKPAIKKAKKTTAKKKTTKKAAIKKTAKKSTAKKAATKKKVTKKSSIKKAAPKKPATKKSTVKKAASKKKVTKKPAIKKATKEISKKAKETADANLGVQEPEVTIPTQEIIDGVIQKEPEKEVVLTDAEGRRYCRVSDCDQVGLVDGYCRYHYLLLWKNIQSRKKILADGKLTNYIEDLTARYPDKFLEILRKDLSSEKDFLLAIQELEIDEGADENPDYEDEARSYIDEIRGVTASASETGSREEEDEY